MEFGKFSVSLVTFNSIISRCGQNLTLYQFNSYLASGDFCRLLITFANSLDPDQDRQKVSPDLDPNSLTLLAFLKDFFLLLLSADNLCKQFGSRSGLKESRS